MYPSKAHASFGNNSFDIANTEALAWAQYVGPEKIFVFECKQQNFLETDPRLKRQFSRK
jgi:hypothetical protein